MKARYFYNKCYRSDPESRKYYFWKVKANGQCFIYWKDDIISLYERNIKRLEINLNVKNGSWIEIPATEAVLMV